MSPRSTSTMQPTLHPTLDDVLNVHVWPAILEQYGDPSGFGRDDLLVALAQSEMIRWRDDLQAWEYTEKQLGVDIFWASIDYLPAESSGGKSLPTSPTAAGLQVAGVGR